jgi:hypothetical protein
MIGIAFEGVSWSDPDYFVFQVLQNLFGTWDHTLGKACMYLFLPNFCDHSSFGDFPNLVNIIIHPRFSPFMGIRKNNCVLWACLQI